MKLVAEIKLNIEYDEQSIISGICKKANKGVDGDLRGERPEI